jgi:hypothetical protein|tara:strand:+ start:237 stop:1166 length:930 start_codon:yes stop_codon:yes gene_type:complete
MATLAITDKLPAPPRADFAFEIDFQKGVGPASRVFAATHEFIKACESLDSELVQSIDSSIETVLILEDIQQGSIRTWLRNALTAVDDDALKSLDWKQQVGKYLVKAKYLTLEFLDGTEGQRSLPDLRRKIQNAAAETDVRHLPDYAPPSPAALISALRDFQGVKDHLVDGDHARLLSQHPSLPEYEFNLSVRFPIESIEELAVARTIRQPAAEMILPVKKPDYLGNSMWGLRHGKRNIEAKILDEAWLRRFQNREEDVRPGDALQCLVATELLYGHDNELIAERYTVETVLKVLVNRYEAPELDFGSEE